jgi:CcmD family protein
MSDTYIVLLVCLIIWSGIFFYLLHLDRLLKKIKQKLEFREDFSKSQR